MARPKNTDGDLDSLGTLIVAAYGLDRSWAKKASCRDWNGVDEWEDPTPWQYNPEQSHKGIKGREMIEIALMVCQNCPVQYDCARYAVEGRMAAGTWSMRIDDLFWLRSQADAVTIIDMVEDSGESMQRAIPMVRSRFVSFA